MHCAAWVFFLRCGLFKRPTHRSGLGLKAKIQNKHKAFATVKQKETVAPASGSVSVYFRVLPWQLLCFILNIRWTEKTVAPASGSVSVHFRVLPWQLLFFILNIRWTESYLRHTFLLLSINISNKLKDAKTTLF